MASEQTLTAIITVVDRATAQFRQINSQIEAFTAPLRHVGDRLAALGEETGLIRIGEHARNALEKVRGLGAGIRGLLGPLAALGAAGSVAGLVEIAKSTGEFAEKLHFGAITANMSTQELAGWHYAAQLVGVDVERLDRGFGFLNRNIALAAQGKAKDVEQILSKMGFHNTQAHLVQTADALKAIEKEAKHLVDSGQTELAEAMLSKLFGARAGMQLLPLFSQGPEAIQQALQEAAAYGIALSDTQTEAGHKYIESMKAMDAATMGLKLAIGNALFPVLTPIIDSMNDWIRLNREWIGTAIGDAVHDFADWVRSINWTSAKEGFLEVVNAAKWLVGEVGGVRNAILAVIAISLAPTILAFGELAWAVGATAASFILIPLGAFLATLISLVPAIDSASAAMVAFDIAADANPIGAFVAAVAAVIAIGYEIYEHWSQISAFFVGLWQGMPEWARVATEAIAAVLFPFIAIPLEIYAHWDQLKPYFEALWNGVTATFRAAWAAIEPIVAKIRDAVDWIMDHPLLYQALTGAVVPGMGIRLPAPVSALPSSPGAIGASALQSTTKVTIDFKNMPPGVAVSTTSTGAPADVNVGQAMLW